MNNKIQIANSKHITETKNVESLLDSSFLQPWLLKNIQLADSTQGKNSICEYGIFTGKHIILIAEKNISASATSKTLKSDLEQARAITVQNAYQDLIHAKQQLQSQKNQIVRADQQELPVTIDHDTQIFCVCITHIHVERDSQKSRVKHRYSSAFTHNLGYSDGSLCPFSFENLLQCLNSLCTYTDFIDFLGFYQSVIQGKRKFADEAALLKTFIGKGIFLNRARHAEKILLQRNLRPHPSKSLREKEATAHVSDFKQLKKQTKFWEQVIYNFTKQIVNLSVTNNAPIPVKHRNMLTAMLSESMYSRAILADCIQDFKRAPKVRQEEGYLVHMRSYSNINRHYVFVFYALDPRKENHRDNAFHRLKNIASGVNFHEQSPVLDEIFVIGLSSHNEGFETDIFYTQGKKLSAEEIQEARSRITNPEKTKVVSRNSLCFCNSGKKYKHCHGATQ